MVFLVARLQFDQFSPRLIATRFIGINGFIESFEFSNRIPLQRSLIQFGLPTEQQHTKLRPPIADVIVRHDTMSQHSKYARQRVTQNGRPDMPHMHRLGDIG